MKTEQHHFVLKEDDKIYHVTMPERKWWPSGVERISDYNEAVQSAITNAVEVSNQEEVYRQLFGNAKPSKHKESNGTPYVYSLQCSVEIKHMKYQSTNNGQYMVGAKPFALVSFQPPVEEGEKETQDELWDEVEYWINFEDRYLNSTEVKKRFTITRKP